MKTFWTLSTLMLVCLCSASASPIAKTGLAAAPMPLLDEGYDAFQSEFAQAQKVNSKSKMASLVKQNQRYAIWWVNETCRAIALQSSDELETRIGDLRVAWNEAYDSEFVERMYSYYSLMRGPQRKSWFELRDEYDKLYNRDQKAKTGQEIELVARDYKLLAEKFLTLGDQYCASECWIGYAVGMDEGRRKDDADLFAACEGYQGALDAYEKMDLQSPSYYEAKARHDVLVKSGFDGAPAEDDDEGGLGGGGADPGAAGGAGSGAGGAGVTLGAPVIAALSYEPVERYDEVLRPLYSLDENYPTWVQLALRGAGSSSKFVSQPEGPKILRVGSAEVEVDVDGDGQADAQIPMTGNFELIELETGEGEQLRRWAFLTTIGIEKDNYQRVEINLAPSDDNMIIYYLPAASALTEVGGVPLRIYDDNLDGVYGSEPLFYYHIGTTSNSLGHAELDSVQVGKEKRARPWSEHLEIDGVWYQMKYLEDGSLEAKPVNPKLGKLALDYSGPKPTWVVVRGLDNLALTFFDLAEVGKKGLEVPVGRYEVIYGEVRKGKKREEMKALMTASKNRKSYTVKQDETTMIELGAPFEFDFETRVDGENLTVVGETVAIVGRGGERYERVWNSRPQPEASWREAGSKRGSKAEDMKLMMNQWDASEFGWSYFWFPFDLVMPLKPGTESPEVQLVEKKNKLFGKIESDWK